MFSDPHLAPRAANFRPLTPLDLLDRTLECHGTRPAVAWREHIWSYAEFGALVARMAGALKAQGIGPSRGGQTTKIHALVDIVGRPAVLRLTPGNASDVKTAPDVLAEAPGRIRRLIADKGYDANWLRKNLRERNTTPIIPGTRSRKRKIRLDKKRYRERWRVEATFCRLKDFRRIATRYDKLARNFASALALAAIVASWC